jgi:hypothetical protein
MFHAVFLGKPRTIGAQDFFCSGVSILSNSLMDDATETGLRFLLNRRNVFDCRERGSASGVTVNVGVQQ